MTICHICDILLSRGEDKVPQRPIDKGKPFERMGHKALEPKSSDVVMEDMVVSCQKGNGRGFKV